MCYAGRNDNRTFLPEQSDPRLRRRQYAPHTAGIEGTLSQGIRAFDLRHTRSIGLAKTRLHQVLVAVAINLMRLFAWFTETPRAGTRTSPFAALAPQPT